MIGLIAGAYCLAVGRDTDGGRRTNATWRHHGTEVIDGNHASRWQHQPQGRRAAVNWATLAATVAATWGAFHYAEDTVATLRAAFWLAATLAVWLVVHRYRRWQHHHGRVLPTGLALADLLGYSRHLDPRTWLYVPRDYRSNPDHPVVVTLPDDWAATEATRKRIVATAAGRLSMSNPDPEWAVDVVPPRLRLRAAPAPPSVVNMAALLELIATAGAGEVVLGGGARGTAVVAAFDGENPHAGLSVTTGGGKSVTATAITTQVLHGLPKDPVGGIALILDPKVVSLQWAKGLPNTRYCPDLAAIHGGLLWLAEEIDHRYRLIGELADVDGNVDPEVVGPRLVVVCEELNTLVPRLQQHWRTIRDPKVDPVPSPAVAALRSSMAMGRQCRVHLVAIAQYLTAAVTGGPDARENLSTRILIRPTVKAWNMLAPECKGQGGKPSQYPASSTKAGRAHVVAGGVARACQIAYVMPAEAREYALSGVVTPFPAGRSHGVSPGTVPAVSPGAGAALDAGTGARGGLAVVPDLAAPAPAELEAPAPLEPRVVSLREACDEGLVARTYDAAKQARTRSRRAGDGRFPRVVAVNGVTERYLAEDLIDWDRADQSGAGEAS